MSKFLLRERKDKVVVPVPKDSITGARTLKLLLSCWINIDHVSGHSGASD